MPTDSTGSALRLDAPFYTEAELDALYERDPVLAMRLSREQAVLQRTLASSPGDASLPLPTAGDLDGVMAQAREILRRDGGGLELVAIEGDVVRVRLTGSCAGCPRSALDLKNVVERLVRQQFPRVSRVVSVG